MGSLVTVTTRKFDSYESIIKLTMTEMQQALTERGVMVAKPDKTTLTSLLLKSVCGEFRLVDDRVFAQQVQIELLVEVANQLAQLKEYLGSLKDAPPSPQQPQLEEELQQLKGLREELKGSHGGFKTVERRLSHQADATQRQQRVFNAVLRNFAGKEGESPKDLQQQVVKELSSQLGVPVELAGARRLPTKTFPRNYAVAAAPQPTLLLLKFKTTEACSTVFRARAKLAGTTWGLDEDLTPLQEQ
jgi:hypothetical protein